MDFLWLNHVKPTCFILKPPCFIIFPWSKRAIFRRGRLRSFPPPWPRPNLAARRCRPSCNGPASFLGRFLWRKMPGKTLVNDH